MCTLKTLIQGILVCILFSSCQKEISVEESTTPSSGGTSSGTAVYTLQGAPGACSTPVINGTYIVGTALSASNTVSIAVNVTTPGDYSISTESKNGIRFTGSGIFITTGSQTILLTGTGTPVTAGTSSFSPGVNACSFSITTTPSGPAAVFTLTGAPSACAAPTIEGIYSTGTALGNTHIVRLPVTVTTAGSYNITTAVVNGFSFSGSGNLAVGNQSIVLYGTGTPTRAGAAVFTPVTGSCSFTIQVASPGGSSVYTLNGNPGACATPVINGTYTAGVPLTGSNTITVTANVTTAGTYSITTTTVNGVTFAGSGTFAVGNAQSVVLTGSGTPASANTSTFTLGTNGCSFPITFTAPPPAAFTLQGTPGVCNPMQVNGSYTTGNPLQAASNNVIVQANVTTIGAYTINTTSANGMTFSGSGVFMSPGLQDVILTGRGTPVAAGTFTFTAGTAGCTFSVPVTAPTSPCTGLVDGRFIMTNQFTLNGISFGASYNNVYQVSIQDGPMKIDVFFPGTSMPAPGTYSIGPVTMECLSSTFVQWNATSGNVYVSIDGAGNRVVQFCNVSFRGTPLMGGATLTSTGSGMMVF